MSHKSKQEKKFTSKKVKNMEILIIFLFIIICVLLIHSFNTSRINSIHNPAEETSCDIVTKPIAVNANPVDKKLEGKTQANYFEGYYNCRNVVRGDLIAYNYAGTKVISKVLGLPGDRFNYERKHIFINGDILTNSEGIPYTIKSGMLDVNNEEFDIIPEGTYIIMGDHENGGNDSGKFGFAYQDNILGKLQLKY